MQNLSAQALRTAVVQAAISDPAFKEELFKNPDQAIATRFGAQPYKIQVIVESENDLTIQIPAKTEQLSQAIERSVKDIGDRTPTRGQFQLVLVHRAWTDDAFLQALRKNAHDALDVELKKYSSSVPADKTVKLYEEQAGECVIILPSPVGEGLTDEELEAVAGGETVLMVGVVIGAAVVGNVVGNVVGAVVGEWVCGPPREME